VVVAISQFLHQPPSSCALTLESSLPSFLETCPLSSLTHSLLRHTKRLSEHAGSSHEPGSGPLERPDSFSRGLFIFPGFFFFCRRRPRTFRFRTRSIVFSARCPPCCPKTSQASRTRFRTFSSVVPLEFFLPSSATFLPPQF